MEATYTPGDGVVVGAGPRWLLLAPDPGPDGTEQLWGMLTGSRPDREILDAVAGACGPDAALALVDLTVGAERSVTRGNGRHTVLDGVHTLDLGPGNPGDPGDPPVRRLVGGVVTAGRLVLRPRASPVPPSPTPPAAPRSGVIDGIPPEILATSASPPTPPTAVPVQTDEPPPESARRSERPEPTVRRDPDHDGHTTYRPAGPGGPGGPPPPPSGGHLQQTTNETVLAVHCPAGHVTAAYSPHCRVCREPVPPQEPHRMPRPRLGTLYLPDGEPVPLDRGVVLGRQPEPVPGGAEWPHLVRLPPDATFVSRSHLSVVLDGWLVIATDLGSRGGTTLRVAGRAPQRIRGHEQYVWEPGQVLDLADSYEIVYEVTE